MFTFADSKCEIEVGTEMHEQNMLPVYRSLPAVTPGYMAGITNKNIILIILSTTVHQT